MTATVTRAGADPLPVRLARAILTRIVRGRATEGTAWGEAMVSEFEETETPAEAVRWTVSSLPVAWRERRKRRSAERRQASLRVRVTRRIVVSLIVAAIAVVAADWLVATVVYEPSVSISPTYAVGSRVLIDKVGFRMTGLHEGDVVVVRIPNGTGVPTGSPHVLRRVIGLPGDTIGCTSSGRLTRNGTVVPYGRLSGDQPARTSCAEVTVPAGDIYVIGDNLNEAFDSRELGPLRESAVVGRAFLTLW
jgi:signal peptidase I